MMPRRFPTHKKQSPTGLWFWGVGLMVIPFLTGCPATQVKQPPPRRIEQVEQKKTPEDVYRDAVSLHESGKQSGNTDYPQVIRLYRQALEEKPNLLEARYNLAAVYEEMGQYSQSAGLLADILRQEANHAPAVYRLSQVYFRMKQHRPALEMMQKFLDLQPASKKQAPMLLNLAAIMLEAGDYEGALRQARQCLVLDKNDIAAYRMIARVYLRQRQYKGVLFVYELSQKLKKQDARLENIRGLAYLGQQDYPQAMLAFQEATRINPQLFEAQMNLGALALQYQDHQRAAVALQAAVQLKPKHRTAWLAYAVAMRANKQFKQAEEAYLKKLLVMNQKDEAALFNLGVLYVKFMNNPKEGKTWLRKFIGEKGDQISNNHPAYQLLKEAEQSILVQERMKQQMKPDDQKPKTNTSPPKPPPSGTTPTAPPPTRVE